MEIASLIVSIISLIITILTYIKASSVEKAVNAKKEEIKEKMSSNTALDTIKTFRQEATTLRNKIQGITSNSPIFRGIESAQLTSIIDSLKNGLNDKKDISKLDKIIIENLISSLDNLSDEISQQPIVLISRSNPKVAMTLKELNSFINTCANKIQEQAISF